MTSSKMRRAIACAAAFGATALLMVGTTACEVEGGPVYPAGYYDDYPPDSFIATTEPFYFEGHAAYWYGNRWYYRDGNHWGHYDREPAGLAQRRMQGGPRRRTYEARPAGGHYGGRGGGRR
jgi:hypothetical protein